MNLFSSFFLSLGDLAVLLAELFLSSSSSKRKNAGNSRTGGGGSTNNHHGRREDPHQKHARELKEALAFFEVNLNLLPKDTTGDDNADASSSSSSANTEKLEGIRESVKKQFRKLSLIHHPDRNENSTESVVMMQKINHYYTIINEELD